MNLYFAVNKFEGDLQVATRLSSIGVSTYARVSDLVAPNELGKKTLNEISSLLKHFEPTRVRITERFNFQRREQAAGESITDYDAALRKLATHCEYGTNLNMELRPDCLWLT